MILFSQSISLLQNAIQWMSFGIERLWTSLVSRYFLILDITVEAILNSYRNLQV